MSGSQDAPMDSIAAGNRSREQSRYYATDQIRELLASPEFSINLDDFKVPDGDYDDDEDDLDRALNRRQAIIEDIIAHQPNLEEYIKAKKVQLEGMTMIQESHQQSLDMLRERLKAEDENLVAGTEQAKADEHDSEAAPPATTKDSHIQRPAQKDHVVQNVQDVQDVAQQQRQ